MKTICLLAATAALLCLAGCKKAGIDPNEASAPVAEIKVKDSNGQYSPAPANLSMSAATGQVELLCTVTDDQGVKSARLEFIGGSSSCTTAGGAVYNGSFSTDGLPASQNQTLSGDASGKVLTKLPLFGTLKGPLSCTVLGSPSQKGTPYGAKMVVRCSGHNWSSNSQVNSASVDLPVALK